MKLSFIATVYNERKAIAPFLDSLLSQTKKVNEIIIVDGGSTDDTESRIKNYELRNKAKKIAIKIITKRGNRSVGRNEAIKHTTGDIILCSDAGNILDKKWVEEITKPFSDPSVDVVAGYYKGKAKNLFQKCLIPYALVMPDKLDPDTFLPATRSIAFKKTIWQKVGKFREDLYHNEDYVFANRLKEKKAKIVFAKSAIVYWFPRTTFKQAFIMFFRFAFGDSEAGIFRTSVLLLLARYFLGLYLIFLGLLYRNISVLGLCILFFVLYILWSIKKNYRYVKNKKAFLILPSLQFTADTAVISGTIFGFFKTIRNFHYLSWMKQNLFFLGVCLFYSLLMLLTIHTGAPNRNHPYPYNMDEWHQLRAVLETFKHGSPNTAGAANGTLFHFLLSGFYVIPFVISKYISTSRMTVFDLDMRAKVFEVLRFSTIIWGVLALFVLYHIAEMIKAAKKLTLFLFTFCPLWLTLSGYFKYDIGLMFWLLLSTLALIHFVKQPTNRNYLLSVIPCALAFSVKVSAIALLPILMLSFFLFYPAWKQNIKYFILGIVMYLGIILLFGMPDMLLGKGNILDYLVNNIFQTPGTTGNIILGMNPWVYLFLKHYPIIFGPGLVGMFIISLGVILFGMIRDGYTKYKIELLFILMGLFFTLSLLPLQILAGGNRSLVLLPFLVLISGIGYARIQEYKNGTFVVLVVVSLLCLVQVYYSFALIAMKLVKPPQEHASEWIISHIPCRTTIGLENIPIYQGIPDILQKEFYFTQSGGGKDNEFMYEVIDSKSKSLPPVVVVTNDQVEEKYYKISPKKELVKRLEKEKYKIAARFFPDLSLYHLNDLDYSQSALLSSPYVTTVYIR